MWLFFLVAWFALLAVIAVLAQQAFGYDIAHLPASFAGLSAPQRTAIGAMLALAAALIVDSTWRLSRQDRSLKTLRAASGRPARTWSSPMSSRTTSMPPSST